MTKGSTNLIHHGDVLYVLSYFVSTIRWNNGGDEARFVLISVRSTHELPTDHRWKVVCGMLEAEARSCVGRLKQQIPLREHT